MFARAFPVPRRTPVLKPLTAHRSANATSKPAAAMRWRALTPAACQLFPVFATQRFHVAKWISAMAWKRGPRARMRHAWSGRASVLSLASGGIER